MTVREIINDFENKTIQLKEEIVKLKEELQNVNEEKRELERELHSLKRKMSRPDREQYIAPEVKVVELDKVENVDSDTQEEEVVKPKRSRKKKEVEVTE